MKGGRLATSEATPFRQNSLGDRQLAQLDEDRLYYFGKLADPANDQDRVRYLTALIGRLNLSGEVGLLYKEAADRLIESRLSGSGLES